MTHSKRQQRWRTRTGKKRIEVYLPADAAGHLDAIACSRGQSRAEVLTQLLRADRPAETVPAASPTDSMPDSLPVDDAPALSPVVGPPEPTPRTTKGYRFRRPQSAEEKRYQWIAVTDAGDRIALGPDPVRYYRWCGRYLSGSLFSRDAKDNSRDAVVHKLIGSPEIYR